MAEGTKLTESIRRGYFFWASVFLLLFVLTGFAPTFYLRSLTNPAPIAGILYLHGAVLTSWFIWLVVQTSLVRSGHTDTHRRMGIVGAVIAAGVVIAGPMATFGLVARMQAGGLDWDTDMSALPAIGLEGITMLQFASGVVWANFASIAIFTTFLIAAITLRKKPQTHKRLILIATIAISSPALGRLARWPILGGEGGPFINIVTVVLLGSVIVYDLVSMKRLHKATIIGCVLVILAKVGKSTIASTEPWLALVRMMG